MPIEVIAGLVGSLTMIALGILVLRVAHGVEYKLGGRRRHPMLDAISAFGGILIGFGAFASWCFLSGGFGVFPGTLTLVVLFEIVSRRRRAQQRAMLGVLAAAAERSIPLVSAVEGFARDEGGVFAYRARRLARLLQDGASLPVAMKRSGTLYPIEIKSLLDVGEESGNLAAALAHAAAHNDPYREVLGQLAGKIAYLGLVFFFMINILTFVMLKIVPSFKMIFMDFSAELPPMTEMLIEVSSLFADFWIIFFLFVCVAVGLVGYSILRYYGWIQWDPPGISRLARRLDSAVILDALALATEQRKPLHSTVGVLANTYHKAGIRGRLHNVFLDMSEGVDWCDSLAKRGLLTRADKAVLQAAQGAGNLPWALREMADRCRRRLALQLQGWVHLAFPPTILLLGTIVAFVVVALFLPLVYLTMSLT